MPQIDYSACNYIEANRRIEDYNSTSNILVEEIPPLRSHITSFVEDKKSRVFVSSMPRAFITAKALFGKEFNIVGEARFVEFDLHFIPLPFLKLKFGTWALISRIIWFLGMLKTKRSFPYERNRATSAAEFLYKEAQKNNVALVAHGMLNMFIEKHLKTKNYKRVSKVKNGFFTIIKLEQKEVFFNTNKTRHAHLCQRPDT